MVNNADMDLAAASERVGDTFRLHLDDGEVIEYELVEASAWKPGSDDERNNFSMLFRGPSSPVLNQATLPLHHDLWGVTELFLVPVGQDEAGTYYESVVNRRT